MNANELADELQAVLFALGKERPFVEHAAMLRQQAKELDEAGHMRGVLREYISDLENGLDSSIKLNKAQAERAFMNNIPHIVNTGASVMNKPVAWMLTLPDGTHDWILDGNGCEGYIPLYTHPVKELTDEEIGDFEYQIIRACGLSTANSDINPIGLRQIIKAILRKAQEK